MSIIMLAPEAPAARPISAAPLRVPATAGAMICFRTLGEAQTGHSSRPRSD